MPEDAIKQSNTLVTLNFIPRHCLDILMWSYELSTIREKMDVQDFPLHTLMQSLLCSKWHKTFFAIFFFDMLLNFLTLLYWDLKKHLTETRKTENWIDTERSWWRQSWIVLNVVVMSCFGVFWSDFILACCSVCKLTSYLDDQAVVCFELGKHFWYCSWFLSGDPDIIMQL